MWVTPRAVPKFTKGVFWTAVEDWWFLQLLKQKTTGSFLDGVLSTVNRVNPLEKQSPLTYRITLNNKFDGCCYIIAGNTTFEKIS
jgi:hypothetical protein